MVEWNKINRVKEYNEINSVVQTSYGGYIACGLSREFGQDSATVIIPEFLINIKQTRKVWMILVHNPYTEVPNYLKPRTNHFHPGEQKWI